MKMSLTVMVRELFLPVMKGRRTGKTPDTTVAKARNNQEMSPVKVS